MSKVICTYATGSHVELVQITAPLRERYAQLHGYEIVVSDTPRTTGIPTTWEKVPLIRELLETHDEVMWIDTDATIVDPSVDIFAAIPQQRSFGMVAHVMNSVVLPNAGVLAVRATADGIAIVERMWELRERYAGKPWNEQAALADLLGFVSVRDGYVRMSAPTVHALHTQFLDPVWNSLSLDQSPLPRIKHYAGIPHAARLHAMRRDRDLVARAGRPPRYDVSVVLPLHAASPADALRALEAIATLPPTPTVQTVLLAPQTGPLEPLLDALQGDVEVLRADLAPDALLLEALPLIEGRNVVTGNGLLVVNQNLISTLCALLDAAHGELAVHRRERELELLAFTAERLPASGWLSDRLTSLRPMLDPAMVALAAAGVRIEG